MSASPRKAKATATMPGPLVVLYLRQSLDSTGLELAVSRQRDACQIVCQRYGWTPALEFVDNSVSASKVPGPGSAYVRLLEYVQAHPGTVVVVYDLDRLTRRPREIEDWLDLAERSGVRLVTADGEVDAGTDNGRMFMRIKAAVARHEVERKGRRQQAANLQAAQAGRWVRGRRPFGYEADGVTIREAEAAAFRAGCEAVLAGVSLRQVAADWNAQGLTTPQNARTGARKGQPSLWSGESVRPTLLNPRYAGFRYLVPVEELHGKGGRAQARIDGIVTGEDGLPIRAEWPALVPEETWRAVVALLMDPARAVSSGPRALLTGLARCGQCGEPVPGDEPATMKSQRSQRGLRQYGCKAAHHNSQAADPVDEYIGMVVVERLSRDDARDLLVDQAKPDLAALTTEANAVRAQLNQLAALLSERVLTVEGVRKESKRLNAKLAALESSQADASRVDVLGPLIDADDVEAAWEALGTERQRTVVDTLMVVTLMPPGKGARRFRPENVVVDWK